MVKPTIFISYSHIDEEDKKELLAHFEVLQHIGANVWIDDKIGAGGDWNAEIKKAMSEAMVAILLITKNFLTSKFINSHEVPELLARREREGLHVMPIIGRDCAWDAVEWLTKMNVKPKNGRPVWGDGGSHVDEDLAAIAREVAGIIKVEGLARERAEQERLAQERAEAERPAREKAEQERLAKDRVEAKQRARGRAKQEGLARERAEREREELTLTLAPGVTLELVRVPAGEFLMGSDKSKDTEANDNETPQHLVKLDTYLLGKYPVTVAQFAAFVDATQHQTQVEKDGRRYKDFAGSDLGDENWRHPAGYQSDVKQRKDHPVTHISWADAKKFCEWASARTQRTVFLPSEAEWEKAARGTDGFIYPWGDSWDASKCNSSDSNTGGTRPVTKFPEGVSPYGALDMVGNVWEWTSSLFVPYPYQNDQAHENQDINAGTRVRRGGSFNDSHYLKGVRAAVRFGGDRYFFLPELDGFRVGALPIYF